jgi:hypothetical protein
MPPFEIVVRKHPTPFFDFPFSIFQLSFVIACKETTAQ